MRTLIANEFIKLRTTRAVFVVLAVQIALIVAGMSGLAVAGLDLRSPNAPRMLLAHAGLSSLLVLVLGILAVAGEYRDGTISETFLATPRRLRVVAAKLVAYTGVGFGFGLLSAAIAFAVGSAWFASKGMTLDLASEEVWRTLLGVVVWETLYAALGVGLGALVPNVGGAITIALAWIALVEGIMTNLLGDLGKWLPMASAIAVSYAPTDKSLPQVTGGVVLAAYVAVFAVAGAVLAMRRDVG